MESWKVGYCWKVATKWNIRVEYFERRRINFVFEKLNMRALFSSDYSISFIYILEEIPGALLFFSVNQLDNNDIPGN